MRPPPSFGRYVRDLRQARGLTQEQLAERSGLSTDAVRRIEHGRFSPTLTTLSKLAHGLRLSLSTFFGGLEDGHPEPVGEIVDFLQQRKPEEVQLVWRMLRAMFDD